MTAPRQEFELLESKLYALFKQVFTENCRIDEESITEEEAKTLDELDTLEIIENFKDLATNLLSFKKQNRCSNAGEL